jgi:uncharacterized SAM-binding protein YcdF (DUF218 family)
MVVLAGGVSRPFYAADLYRRGLAPEVWLSRPYRSESERMALELGAMAPEEEINRKILIMRGVPPKCIHLYGDGVMSTLNEALALRAAAQADGKRILLITSRFHARRAALIFRRAMPRATILACSTPYEAFSRRWWRSQHLAREAVLETSKTLFYLLGGRFLSPLENTPNQS